MASNTIVNALFLWLIFYSFFSERLSFRTAPGRVPMGSVSRTFESMGVEDFGAWRGSPEGGSTEFKIFLKKMLRRECDRTK